MNPTSHISKLKFPKFKTSTVKIPALKTPGQKQAPQNSFIESILWFCSSMNTMLENVFERVLRLEVKIANLQKGFNEVELLVVGKTNLLANRLQIHEDILKVNSQLEQRLSLLKTQYQNYKQNREINQLNVLLQTMKHKLQHIQSFQEQKINNINIQGARESKDIIKELIRLIVVPTECQKYLTEKVIQNIQLRRMIIASQRQD